MPIRQAEVVPRSAAKKSQDFGPKGRRTRFQDVLMARDEARHGKAFEGLLKRYFGKAFEGLLKRYFGK